MAFLTRLSVQYPPDVHPKNGGGDDETDVDDMRTFPLSMKTHDTPTNPWSWAMPEELNSRFVSRLVTLRTDLQSSARQLGSFISVESVEDIIASSSKMSLDPTGKKLPSAKTSRIQIDPYPVGARCEVIPKARKEEPHPDEKLVSENAHLKRRISQQIKDRDTLLTENKDLLSMLVKSRDHIRTLEQERNWLTTKLEERTQSTSVRVTRKLRRASFTKR